MHHTTITAIATASGKGGVGIVRVSGAAVQEIAKKILKKIPVPRKAEFLNFYSPEGILLDQGIAVFFAAPHSFTGEDVLELQGHGGDIVLDQILQAVVASGARLAEPGEFSKRAFLNNKIDLAQAEAIADLIAAQSVQAAQAALNSLTGEFSFTVQEIVDELINLRVYIEAAIDFPEEEIDFLSDGIILKRIKILIESIEKLQKQAKQGSVLREGLTVVITGAPNAGKSSLLNALAGNDIAIVTDIPGTTRDLLKEKILIEGVPLNIIDTAGLRESNDVVEQEGIRRAQAAVSKAQGILLMIDISHPASHLWEKEISSILALSGHQIPIVVLANKIDLLSLDQQKASLNHLKQLCVLQNLSEVNFLLVSAKTKKGLEDLQKILAKWAGVDHNVETSFLARRRHLEAIALAEKFILAAQNQLLNYKAGELVAEELRQAQLALEEITGKFTADDLLGNIFSSFCIGK